MEFNCWHFNNALCPISGFFFCFGSETIVGAVTDKRSPDRVFRRACWDDVTLVVTALSFSFSSGIQCGFNVVFFFAT